MKYWEDVEWRILMDLFEKKSTHQLEDTFFR